jgi:hypothetical protein
MEKKEINGIVPFKKEFKYDTKIGFKDLDGNVVIKPKYAEWGTAPELIGGLATFVEPKNSLHGIINYKAQILVEGAYDTKVYEEGLGIYETLSCTKVNGVNLYCADHRFGFVNNEGDFIVSCEYSKLMRIKKGYYYFAKGSDEYGILEINVEGKTRSISFDMKSAGYEACDREYYEVVAHGLLCVKKNGLWGVLTVDGKEVVPCKYSHVRQWGRAQLQVWDGDQSFTVNIEDLNNITIKPDD